MPLSVSLPAHVCPRDCVYGSLSVCLSVYLTVYLSAVGLPMHMFIHLALPAHVCAFGFFCVIVRLFICPCICPSACLSVHSLTDRKH